DNRLVVLDPATGNYSYVNATDVAPSGPPPGKTSAGVIRGVLDSAGGSSASGGSGSATSSGGGGGSPGVLHDLLRQ
ncbi:MAG TPA: hypothetical protein VKU60_02805, partial [Chloroflexota bacterium]|nr:hypothetical protein [Chloroflexota bacterium]